MINLYKLATIQSIHAASIVQQVKQLSYAKYIPSVQKVIRIFNLKLVFLIN